MDIGSKFKVRKSRNIETAEVRQKRSQICSKSSKTTNFRKNQIGNHLIIIFDLGFKFQVRKSKNIEYAYIPKKTLKYGPNRTK